MKIVMGCDHAGFPMKKRIVKLLRQMRHAVTDVGTYDDQPVDYPDYAQAMAHAIQSGRAERGIFLCGSGVGASIAANKFRGIRAALCHDCFSARQAVEDDDANVLCLGTRVIGPGLALELVRTYVSSRFSQAARHRRRLSKIERFEESSLSSPHVVSGDPSDKTSRRKRLDSPHGWRTPVVWRSRLRPRE